VYLQYHKTKLISSFDGFKIKIMEKIFTVKKEYAKNLNRKERRKLAAKIRKDLAKEKNILKKDKAEPFDSADDGRKSV